MRRALWLLLLSPALAGHALAQNAGEQEDLKHIIAKAAAPEKAAGKSAGKSVEPVSPANADTQFNAIRLRGLNKVTARISTLEAPIGTVMRFGNLEVIAHRCWQSAPEEQPETAGLLEIRELKPDEPPQRIFSGWMFASSPALSALEHPVYDITVLSCSSMQAEEQ